MAKEGPRGGIVECPAVRVFGSGRLDNVCACD